MSGFLGRIYNRVAANSNMDGQRHKNNFPATGNELVHPTYYFQYQHVI
jgi:hypothetical protein